MVRYFMAVPVALLFAALLPGEMPEGGKHGFGLPQAEAQPMGREGWNFASRNRTTYSQYQFIERSQNGNGVDGGGNGIGALNQYVTNYNSSSTSIGNYNEINQILGAGAEGYLAINNNQTSTGNQTSQADTQVSVDNSTAIAEGDGASANAGGNSESPPPSSTE